MVRHGDRCEAKPSLAGGFPCHHCGQDINVGDIVVGFKNTNKILRRSWDHVHDACADLYHIPVANTSLSQSASARIGEAVSSVFSAVAATISPTQKSSADKGLIYGQKAETLGFTPDRAAQVLAQFGGDHEAAFNALTKAWMSDARYDLAEDGSQGAHGQCADCADPRSEPPLVQQQPAPPSFGSAEARVAVLDVFLTFLKPLFPKPQTDGSFKDGDPELLDQLLESPCMLCLPRAERLADIVKCEEGWSAPSLERARNFFALTAAGVRYLLYLPTITHRQELSRSDFFKVVSESGETIGVRDCCPDCRSNAFVNVTEGLYNIRKVKDAARNGVRFLLSTEGCLVPISRSGVCRNPTCPPIVQALLKRGIVAPSTDRSLPTRGKAPDGKVWPKHTFSTHSPTYIAMIKDVLPHLGILYAKYTIFDSSGCDYLLAAKLMQTEATVAHMTKELKLMSEQREKAALERYIAYMHNQQLLLTDRFSLPSALELSRPSASLPPAAPLSSSSLSHLTSVPLPQTAASIIDPFMRRWFKLRSTIAQDAHEEVEIESDEDTRTVTTANERDAALHEPAASAPRVTAPELAGAVPELIAPPWQFVSGVASVLIVSDANIRTIMRHVHATVKPHLTADLLRRHPGEIASSDHTFRIAMRSIGNATAYCFFMGEDHTVFWHGAVSTTAWAELAPALEACERRFKRLGVSGLLKLWWDDLCCRGVPADRLHEHVVVHTFPSITR